MKPITFENLRRLVGGGRKKKDKESSFKRSDSFKRISIRKSYLDRGKKKHLQKLEVATQTVSEEEQRLETESENLLADSIDKRRNIVVDTRVVKKCKEKDGGKEKRRSGGPGQSVIAYGQWLKGICKDDTQTSGIKGSERTVIYIPASDEHRHEIRQLTSSPTYRKVRSTPDYTKISTPALARKESNDSAVEMFPWGDSADAFKKSPLIRRKQRLQSPVCNNRDVSLLPAADIRHQEELCSLSISLGRIWMDAPQVMSPRSLELPQRVNSTVVTAHNSLDSALKDFREDNRLQKRCSGAANVVGRTLSSTSNATTASTGLFSSKDSGFSLSISIPKLEADEQAATKGFFRKKKQQKPKLSVSRDGYFKRTSGALLNESITNSRRSSYKKSSMRKRNLNNMTNDLMYQVVVNRPPRCLKSLKLDPMIFVPPEKRQTNSNNNSNKSLNKKPSFKLNVKEIRNCNPNENEIYLGNNKRDVEDDSDDNDEGLYESLPEEESVNCSYDMVMLSGRMSRISLREEDVGFPNVEHAVFSSEAEAEDENDDSHASSTLISPVVSDVEEEEQANEEVCSDSLNSSDSMASVPYLVQGVSPVPKRRPVRRRKSGVLPNKRITYVARPVIRAPSTLKRNTKKIGDITQKGYEKKRTRLLSPYIPKQQSIIDPSTSSSSNVTVNNCTPSSGVQSNRDVVCQQQRSSSSGVGGDGGGRDNKHRERDRDREREREREREQQSRRRTQRRVTHNEKRYHSASSAAVHQPQASQQQLLQQQTNSGDSPSNRAVRRGNRRLTRNESRYHSEVRQEAVQQALAQAMQGRHKPSLPMPSKRTSVMARSPDRIGRDSAESTTEEDDDLTNQLNNSDSDSLNHPNQTNTSTPERDLHNHPHYHYPITTHLNQTKQSQALPPPPLTMSDSTNSSTQGSPPPPIHRPRLPPPPNTRDLANDMHNFRPYNQSQIQTPDVTHVHASRVSSSRTSGADRVNRSGSSSIQTVVEHSSGGSSLVGGLDNLTIGTTGSSTGTAGRWKVSAKIQQLLNTLKRPKRRPLPEFYEDDDIELELAANVRDPNAPKPEGSSMTPVIGEQLVVPSGLPRNIESAITRYGSASYKAPVATVLDPNGKLTTSLTYGKLLSRSYKIAYALLTKSFGRIGDTSLKSGDRVALVYPNSDPVSFLCAFYGCLQAGIVPVPIEVPITRRDAGSLQIGFLLGSCGVQVALTSEACLKGLPKTAAGDVAQFKGWPRLNWFVTEHLPRTPKDWLPAPRLTDETPAYIEYSTDRGGSVMGVTVTRAAMLSHCRTVTMACGYTEGENMVCVLDFKREVGLWHSVLASVLNGMHVIYIPYALMKVNPASWMQMITKYRASVAVCKSRDLHWGLLATKDHKDISLASLRMLLVADGANPWSLSSCDQFLSVFQPKGLKPDAICPSASSSEVLTVSVRRPGRAGVNSTGRGVLSMQGLSYGVVRVDQEHSLTSLTLQDCGQVMPGCVIVVVKMDGPAYLCKTDEVGEICINSGCTGTQYWGLTGLSTATFRVSPLNPTDGHPISDTAEYTRSGLLGFLGPGGLVFICGSRDGLMTVTGRKHNADDIIATVLAVEPMKFIYRGRIAVFSHRVLRDERVCVIAEQRPDCSEEESFQWMSRVLQAVDSIHQVGLYCLALVPPNYLPKTPLGGIHLSETKRRFLEGTLHPANVLLCPHTCVTNLPKPREIHSASASSDVCCVSDVGPASVIVGNLVQGNRLASAQGRDMGDADDGGHMMEAAKKQQFISEILRWRAQSTADHNLYTLLNSKGTVARTLTCADLHKRAERVAQLLTERGRITAGAHVALIFPPGLDLVCAFYGCLYAGAVPVTIRPPHPQNLHTTLPTVRMIVDVSKSQLILSIPPVIKLLKSKEASNVVDIKSWPSILDTDDTVRTRKPSQPPYRPPTAELLAYLDFSVSTTGMLAGIKMSHSAVTNLCRSMKLACELYPSRHIALCLDPYCGLGFALWCLSSIYSGHHSILIPPSEVEVNPGLWLGAVSQYKVRDTFCSYGVMELCTKGLTPNSPHLSKTRINLSCVRTCVVVAEERPRIHLTQSFSKLFSSLGLSPRAVSTSFGCRVNVAICLQGASSPEPSSVYVDLRALRNDRVSLVERGSPHSLCLMESGKLLPGVKVIIANPETRGQCGDSHLGEIWVQAGHVASGYFTIYGDEGDCSDHFTARLVVGNTSSNELYARTGYLGFLRRTTNNDQIQSIATNDPQDAAQVDPATTTALVDGQPLCVRSSSLISTCGGDDGIGCEMGDLHDAVFVVGALDETILLRGMRYHPIDIEGSVLRCHKKIAECAVFTWTNLLVVVAELDGNESEALDLVPLITNAVLEEQQLVVGVVVVVDPGVVPINSRGEKQRMHLRDGFLADQLDPIYVAYNM